LINNYVLVIRIKFLPGSRVVFGSLLFVADKMGEVSLQEPESREIVGLDTRYFPPAPTQVGVACEARLEHGSNRSGEFESDPSRDNVNHRKICCSDATNPIYKPLPKSNSDGGREVYDGAG
jgi:hypothetical protein